MVAIGFQIGGVGSGGPDLFPELAGQVGAGGAGQVGITGANQFGMAGDVAGLSAVGGDALSSLDPQTGLPTRAATTFAEAAQFSFAQNQFVNRLAQRSRAQAEATIQQALGLVGRGGPGSLAALTSPLFTQLANIRGQTTFQPFDFTAGIPRPAPSVGAGGAGFGGFGGGGGGGSITTNRPPPVIRGPDQFFSQAQQQDPFGLNAILERQRIQQQQAQGQAGQDQFFGGGGGFDFGAAFPDPEIFIDDFLGGGGGGGQAPLQDFQFGTQEFTSLINNAFGGGGFGGFNLDQPLFDSSFGSGFDQGPEPIGFAGLGGGDFSSLAPPGGGPVFDVDLTPEPQRFFFEASDPQFAEQGLNPSFKDLVSPVGESEQFAGDLNLF